MSKNHSKYKEIGERSMPFMTQKLQVALVYTVEKNMDHTKNPHSAEQLNKTNRALEKAMIQLGYQVHLIPGDYDLLNHLHAIKPDVIFNNCTGIHDKSSQPQLAGLLEMSKIPFTGSGQTAHTLCLYKPLTKKILLHYNIATPNFFVVNEDRLYPEYPLQFPVIVKPEHEGSSIGITAKSVVYNEEDMKKMVEWILTEFHQPALVEEFITGREFTVGIWDDESPKILPLVEVLFDHDQSFYSAAVKSKDSVKTQCPANIDEELHQKIEKQVLDAFKALNLTDYARIDVRVDASGTPYIIDVNSLPGLEPHYSDYPNACAVAGIQYEQMVDHILQRAFHRGKA